VACGRQRTPEQVVDVGIAAEDAVQHDDVGLGEVGFRAVADLERDAIVDAALRREPSRLRDGPRGKLDAESPRGTVLHGCDRDVSDAAADVEHRPVANAGIDQRLDQRNRDGGRRRSASHLPDPVVDPVVEAAVLRRPIHTGSVPVEPSFGEPIVGADGRAPVESPARITTGDA
jgi:hypothetical protein